MFVNTNCSLPESSSGEVRLYAYGRISIAKPRVTHGAWVTTASGTRDSIFSVLAFLPSFFLSFLPVVFNLAYSLPFDAI
jgi:hypothetical protein